MKKIKENKFISILWNIFNDRMLFSSIYLLTAILWFFPLLGAYVDPIAKLVFVWGAAMIAVDLFTKRTLLTGYKSSILILLSALYIVTIIFNIGVAYTGIKNLIYNGILMFVVYPFNKKKDFNYYKKAIVVLNDIIIAVVFVATVISLVMFTLRFSYVFKRGDMIFNQGFISNRLAGVYTSANVGALFSILTIAFTVIIYGVAKNHFKKFKWAYIINAIVQFLYYSVTLSRGGQLFFIAFLASISLVFVYPRLIKNSKKIIAGVLAFVFFATSVFVLEAITVGSRKLMVQLPKLVSTIDTDDNHIPNEPEEDIVLERTEDLEGEVTNGRLSIWEAGLAILKKNPVFGIVDAKIYSDDKLIADFDESTLTPLNINELKRVNGYMHNAIIQILVCSGILGLAVFLVFAVFLGTRYLKYLIRLYGTEYYKPLASIFVIIAMMVSQIFSEAHILFNRQDPHAIIFWLYLGFGIYIICNAKYELSDADLFVCDTPYQIVNAVNYKTANKEQKTDIYIYNQFASAKTVAENLKKTKMFDNVVLFDKYLSYSGIKQKLITLIRIATPKITLKKHMDGKAKLKNYKTVFLSCFTPFTDSVRLLNPYAKICEYEDGTGSYFHNDLANKFRTGIFDIVNKLFLGGTLSYKRDTIYLNHPEVYTLDENKTILPLPKITNTNALKIIFNYTPNSKYTDNKIIYLTQPLKETSVGTRAEEIEKQVFSLLGDSALIRVHPRQSVDSYSGYKLDTENNLWEIECAEQITDDHILIGAFSTAMFIPKMLYNKEPMVIFTYELYGEHFNDFVKMVDMLRSMYKNPEKIIVAENIDTLKRCLG